MVASLLAGAAPKPALAQGRMEWRMVTAWPRAASDLIAGAERLAQRIGQLSDGRLTVKVLAAGELVPEGQVFDAVSQGMAELGHGVAHDHLSKTVGSAFFAAVPFGLAAEETAAWINHGGGQALWDELYAAFNVKPFLAGNTGPRPLGWFRREAGGRCCRPGTICYLPGVQAPGTALELVVNKQKFDALAADLKAILRAAAEASHADIESEQNFRSSRAFEILKQTRGVRVLRASNELLIGLGEAANALLTQERQKADPTTKRIYASYLEARGRLVPYERGLAEAYAAARGLKYKYPA